jgi:hypothetical protein
VDRRTFESPTHKTLAGLCNNVIVWLQYLQPLLDIPQTEKPEIHELTAEYLLRGFLPQSLAFGVRGPLHLWRTFWPLSTLLGQKVPFSVVAGQQPEMFANAEHDVQEIVSDTKLVPSRQHHLHFRNKYHIGHFTVGIIFQEYNTLRRKIPSKQ